MGAHAPIPSTDGKHFGYWLLPRRKKQNNEKGGLKWKRLADVLARGLAGHTEPHETAGILASTAANPYPAVTRLTYPHR